jgi:hypothetical protein
MFWGIGLHSKAFISREFNKCGGGGTKWRLVFFYLKPSNRKEDTTRTRKRINTLNSCGREMPMALPTV